MGDKWTTSGRSRLRALQKRNRSLFPGTGVNRANASRSRPRASQTQDEPKLRRGQCKFTWYDHQRWEEPHAYIHPGRSDYSAYADPFLRRAVAGTNQFQHTPPPVQTRRIRNPNQRRILAHYNPNYNPHTDSINPPPLHASLPSRTNDRAPQRHSPSSTGILQQFQVPMQESFPIARQSNDVPAFGHYDHDSSQFHDCSRSENVLNNYGHLYHHESNQERRLSHLQPRRVPWYHGLDQLEFSGLGGNSVPTEMHQFEPPPPVAENSGLAPFHHEQRDMAHTIQHPALGPLCNRRDIASFQEPFPQSHNNPDGSFVGAGLESTVIDNGCSSTGAAGLGSALMDDRFPHDDGSSVELHSHPLQPFENTQKGILRPRTIIGASFANQSQSPLLSAAQHEGTGFFGDASFSEENNFNPAPETEGGGLARFHRKSHPANTSDPQPHVARTSSGILGPKTNGARNAEAPNHNPPFGPLNGSAGFATFSLGDTERTNHFRSFSAEETSQSQGNKRTLQEMRTPSHQSSLAEWPGSRENENSSSKKLADSTNSLPKRKLASRAKARKESKGLGDRSQIRFFNGKLEVNPDSKPKQSERNSTITQKEREDDRDDPDSKRMQGGSNSTITQHKREIDWDDESSLGLHGRTSLWE